MVSAGKGDILPEPCGREECVGSVLVRELDLGQKKRGEIAEKHIKFDFQTIFHGDDIAVLGDEPSVNLRAEMQVRFLGERKIVLFADHEPPGFVGQLEVIVILPDADHRLRGEITLLNMAAEVGGEVKGDFIYQIFAFDFHMIYLSVRVNQSEKVLSAGKPAVAAENIVSPENNNIKDREQKHGEKLRWKVLKISKILVFWGKKGWIFHGLCVILIQ
nr:hypothetical protein [Hespellia stercorisuis]